MEFSNHLFQNWDLEPESLVLAELNRVLGQELDEVGSEQRLDLAYEVIETVRFEQSHISWLDRLRNTTSAIELQIAHTQLPIVNGNLIHQSDPFLILKSSQAQFLINAGYVIAASGLNHLSGATKSQDAFNWLENVWFHDLSDRRALGTWFLKGDYVVDGHCLRTGFDAIDIATNSKVITFPKNSVVAGRIMIDS